MNAILGSSPIKIEPPKSFFVDVYQGNATGSYTLPKSFNTLIVIGPTNSSSLYVWNTHITKLNIGSTVDLRVFLCDNTNSFNGNVIIAHPTGNTFSCTNLTYRDLPCTYAVIGLN